MPPNFEDLERRVAWIEAKLTRLETKWDEKLDLLLSRDDHLQDRINVMLLAALATLGSITLALLVLLLTHSLE